MEIGQEWAYREPPWQPGKPFARVELLQFGPPISNKVRIRLLEGEFQGIDQWVPKRRLEVPWPDAEAALGDELCLDAVYRVSAEQYERVANEAAWIAFFAYPRPDGISIGWRNSRSPGTVFIDDVAGVCADLCIQRDFLFQDGVGFINRHGTFAGPWAIALQLAIRVCDFYPSQVLEHLHKEESELEDQSIHGHYYMFGRDTTEYHIPAQHYIDELREMKPVFALVRQWCGVEQASRFDELVALREEVKRLKGIIEDAARDFQNTGHPRVATKLRRQLRGPG